MVIINGWEAGIRLPYSGDMNQHHRQVFAFLRSKVPGWQHHSDAGRCVQFVASGLADQSGMLALLRFTGDVRPEGVPVRDIHLPVQTGDRMRVQLRLSATQKETGTNRQVAVPDEALDGYVARKMNQAGLQLDAGFRWVRERGMYVGKGQGFGVDVVMLDGMATVLDPEALKQKWERGLGRQRTFGLGMLRLSPGEAVA